MTLLSTARTVFIKDLRIELRTREILYSTFVFALVIVVLSAFAFDLHAINATTAAAGALWISMCFAGLLAIGRSWLGERESGAWPAVVRCARSSGGLFLGKAAGVATFLLLVQVVLLPVTALFFPVPVRDHLHVLILIMAAGITGFSAAGTLFGAMSVRSGPRDLLLGIVLFPLISPVLILSARATALTFSLAPIEQILGLLRIIAALDIVFVALGILLFGFLMED